MSVQIIPPNWMDEKRKHSKQRNDRYLDKSARGAQEDERLGQRPTTVLLPF